MTRGKSICNVLKTIRKQIAEANEIMYEPRECHHIGECRGTCPACEAEVRYIERQLDIRKQLGRAVTLVGISAGLSALSACGDKAKEVKEVEKDSLIIGKVVTESDTHLTGDIDYRSPEDCVIVEKRQPTAKIRTAKFKASPKKEEVDTAYTEVMKGAVDVIPVGQVPEEILMKNLIHFLLNKFQLLVEFSTIWFLLMAELSLWAKIILRTLIIMTMNQGI